MTKLGVFGEKIAQREREVGVGVIKRSRGYITTTSDTREEPVGVEKGKYEKLVSGSKGLPRTRTVCGGCSDEGA